MIITWSLLYICVYLYFWYIIKILHLFLLSISELHWISLTLRLLHKKGDIHQNTFSLFLLLLEDCTLTLLKHTPMSICSFPLLVIRPLCFSCWNLRPQRKPTTASMASTLRTVSGVSIISSTTTWRNFLGAALPDSLAILSQKLLLPAAYTVAPNTVTTTSIYNRKQPHHAIRNHLRMM